MCDCKVCQHHRQFAKIIKRLKPENRKFLEDLYTSYICADEDATVSSEMLKGRWSGYEGLMVGAS